MAHRRTFRLSLFALFTPSVRMVLQHTLKREWQACVKSCCVWQERHSSLTGRPPNALCASPVPGGTRKQVRWVSTRLAKRFWTCGPLLLYQQWTAARLMGEGRTPVLLRRAVSVQYAHERAFSQASCLIIGGCPIRNRHPLIG